MTKKNNNSKNKNNQIKQKPHYDNNNNNNNGTLIDSNNNNNNNEFEYLFWKIFKNKYLLKIIFNIINNDGNRGDGIKIKSFKYNEIISVKWMLKNGYIELLKEKVINGDKSLIDFIDLKYYPEQVRNSQYFNNKPTSYKEISEISKYYSIFEYIQNDIKFYKLLFKNYPQYFIKSPSTSINDYYQINTSHSSNNYTPIDLLDYSINMSLKFDNLCSFQLLIQQQQQQQQKQQQQQYCNVDMFYRAIDIGSIKIAKFIYKYLNLIKNDLIAKVWKNSTFIGSNNTSKSFKLINKIVNFLINDLKFIPPKEINKISEDIFNVDLKSITVQDLFEICKTISLLLENTNLFENYLNDTNMDYSDKFKYYIPNSSIDFLTINQLNEMEPSISSSLIVGTISKNDNNIFKLFKMALPFTNYSTNHFKENYLFFKCKYFNDLSQNTILYNLPIEFGLYNDLIEVPNQEEYQDDLKEQPIILFKYINEDNEKQIKFIQDFIKDFKNNNSGGEIKKLKILPINLMKLLLSIDRLDLIKIIIEESINLTDILPPNLMELIKSTTTFDYFYKYIIFNGSSSSSSSSSSIRIIFENCLKNNNNINLMNYIKFNYKELYNQFIIMTMEMEYYDSDSGNNRIKFNYSIESLLFIYKNLNDFKHCYKSFEIWTRPWNYFKKNQEELTLEQFKILVEYTPMNESYSYLYGSPINDEYDGFTLPDCSLPIFNGSVLAYQIINSFIYWNENDFNSSKYKKTYLKLQWVKLNRPLDLISKRCNPYYGIPSRLKSSFKLTIKTFKSLYNLQFGNFSVENLIFKFLNETGSSGKNQANSNNNNFNIKLKKDYLFYFNMSYYIGSRGDVNALDKILHMVLENSDNFKSISNEYIFKKNFITRLLVISTYHGRINILNHLKLNHSWVFDLNNDGIISSSIQPDSLIKIANFTNNLDLIFYFKNIFFLDYFKEKDKNTILLKNKKKK